MCGIFPFEHEWPAFIDLYDLPWETERGRNTAARFSIAPTQSVLIVRNDGDGNQMAEEARWWLVPFWAKELPKAAMLDARIETVDTASAFREAFKSKRCLIPASAFYEWTVVGFHAELSRNCAIGKSSMRTGSSDDTWLVACLSV